MVTAAEEASAWAGVTAPDGLGFRFKWNMGWMNDTLRYVAKDPVHRAHHHELVTFGLMYAWNEAFILPLSHDEVVHGKGTLLGRLPGDDWQRFATLRCYYAFMWGHPGKKLLFMGQEFAPWREWSETQECDWWLLQHTPHRGVQDLVRRLNTLHRAHPALHARDCEPEGFRWIDADDAAHSMFSWLRFDGAGGPPVAVICNFTPVPRGLADRPAGSRHLARAAQYRCGWARRQRCRKHDRRGRNRCALPRASGLGLHRCAAARRALSRAGFLERAGQGMMTGQPRERP